MTQKMNVTYLIPFAGNRMVSRTGGPVHILRREELTGSVTYCGRIAPSGSGTYSRAARAPKDREICGTCIDRALEDGR